MAVVTGSVTYQDVGLKLEFEPQVYSDQEVGIRISLEVSNIVKEIPGPNGSLAYQIGTRNAQTVLRLRDGETQILGGLISAADRNTSTRVPGLGHLPMVGKLFGNNSGTDNKTEIILAITPRILRPPAVLDAAVRSVFSGTEGSVRERALQLDPIGVARGQSTGSPTSAQAPAIGPARAPTTGATGSAGGREGSSTGSPTPAGSAPSQVRSLLPLMNGNRIGAGGTPPPAAGPTPSEPAAPAVETTVADPKVSQ